MNEDTHVAAAEVKIAMPSTREAVRRGHEQPGSVLRGLQIVLSRWRVELGFVCGALILAMAHPTLAAVSAWLPVAAVGLALRAWARGYLERRRYLTQAGPYRYLRHPLYVGSYFTGLSFAAMTATWTVPALFTLAFVAAYVPKGLREEAFLRERYGEDYRAYAAAVGAVLPCWRGPQPPHRERFEWRRVLAHGEWRTWTGAVAVLAVLTARAAGWVELH